MNNFAQKLISFDKREYDKMLGYANQDLAEYNKIVIALEQHTPEIKYSLETLKALWNEPSEHIFDLLTEGKELTFMGIKVTKKKALEFVELQDNHKILIDIVHQLKEAFSAKQVHATNPSTIPRLSIEDTEFVKDKLVLTDVFIDKCKQEVSVYTANEIENHILEGVTALNNTLNNVLALGLGSVSDVNGLEAFGISNIQRRKTTFDPNVVKKLAKEYERSHRPHVEAQRINPETKLWNLKGE